MALLPFMCITYDSPQLLPQTCLAPSSNETAGKMLGCNGAKTGTLRARLAAEPANPPDPNPHGKPCTARLLCPGGGAGGVGG